MHDVTFPAMLILLCNQQTVTQHLWAQGCSVLDMSCFCGSVSCGDCMHDRLMQWHQEQDEIEEMNDDLIVDFPEFQDETCKAILKHMCEHDSENEGTCCLVKRRRIMEDAEPLAEAWKSGYRLKNAYKKDKLPAHFVKVCNFLGLDMTELS